MRTCILITMLSLVLLALAAAGAGAQTQAESGPLPPVGAEAILALPSDFGDSHLSAPADVTAVTAQFPIQDVRQVATGEYHTCILTTAGGVKCWGRNDYGQLGDGTTANKGTPTDVVGLGSGVAAVTAGELHTCALTTAGGVKCWGANDYGQLGDGTITSRLTPVEVSGLTSGVAAVAPGYRHTCALTIAGGVKCWGANNYGQLGDGTTTSRRTPVEVSRLASGVAAVAAGYSHTCALTTAGGAKCWGGNNYGLLGDGTYTDRRTPVDVFGLGSGVAAITTKGGHTCALTTAGGVKCWGLNDYGQLGDDTTANVRNAPVDVVGLGSGAAAVAADANHTCALTATGGVRCWGWNSNGQLGNGTRGGEYRRPVNVLGLGSGVAAVALGDRYTCALTTAGGVKCWGLNDYGQLGNGWNGHDQSTPVDVFGLGSGVAAVAAAWADTCALTTAGGVKCWGDNTFGQLGNGWQDPSTPADVVGLGSGVAAVTVGGGHTCALTAAGGVKCWGYNSNGELGDGTTAHKGTPADVTGLGNGAAAVAAGGYHTCAVTVAGGVKCWGANSEGQLGDGTTVRSSIPIDVVGLGSRVTAVTAGSNHTCALTTAGGVKCWGYNYSGQLGNGTTVQRSIPVDVVGLGSGVAAVTAGGVHTCALTAAGGVKCWGEGGRGQLGDGTTVRRSIPVDVIGLGSRVTAVTAGGGHTCAVTAAGGVKCWGDGGRGQLGDGTTVQRSIPVDVVGLGSGLTAVTAGGDHTCALTAAGGVKCWGYNYSGQLGDGTAWHVTAGDVLVGCYTLALTHTGEGSDPTASLPRAITCPARYYSAGTAITLAAAPAADWRVAGWSGTSNDASTATTNSLIVPAADRTVTVHYAPPFRRVYLPIVLRRWPPTPDAPTLNAIAAPGVNPSYTVSWNAAYLADTYILEQATNASFSDAAQVYTGAATSKVIRSEGIATYRYRAKARNQWGDSGWSDVQAVEVRWEREPNYPSALANGPLQSGVDYYGYPNDTQDYFTFQTTWRGQITVDLTNHTGQGVQLVLYYPRDVEVARAFAAPYHLVFIGDPGAYYVQIYAESGHNTASPYTLRATFP